MVDYKLALWIAFESFKKLILSIVIAIMPIVSFALIGFGLEIARNPKRMPSWRDFKSHWIKGVQAVAVSFVYMIPVLLVLSVTMITEAADIPIFIGLVIFGLLAAYVLPMALLELANGRFRDAFSFKEVFSLAFTLKYLGAWLSVLIVSIILGLILNLIGILLAITIIGPFLISGLISCWITVFSFSVYGQIYKEL